MKSGVCLFVLLACVGGCTPAYRVQDVCQSVDGLYDKQTQQPITGTVKRYYPNGQIKEEIFYQNGRMTGPVKGYDENGVLYEETVYRNKEKERQRFFKNGKVSYETIYFSRHNMIDKRYNEQGYLTQEVSCVGYKRDGITKLYDEKGHLKTEILYRDNQLVGIYQNGRLVESSADVYSTYCSGLTSDRLWDEDICFFE